MRKMIRNYPKYPIFILILLSVLVLAAISGCSTPPNISKDGVLDKDTILIKKGIYEISDKLDVPKGKTLVIEPGAVIKVKSNLTIIIEGKIIARGTPKDQIVFEAAEPGDFWRGIYINGQMRHPDMHLEKVSWKDMQDAEKLLPIDFFESVNSGNVLENCVIRNIKQGDKYESRVNNYKAAVEARNTTLAVLDSTFEDINFINAIDAFDSYLVASNSSFLSCGIHKTIHLNNTYAVAADNRMIQVREAQDCNDGFWVITSMAIIKGNFIQGKGDDAIDSKSSVLVAGENNISNCKDEGIDTDSTKAFIYMNEIRNNSQSGIQLSDSTEGVLLNNRVFDNHLNGLSIRNRAFAWSINDSIYSNEKEELKMFVSQGKDLDEEVENITCLNKNISDRVLKLQANALYLEGTKIEGYATGDSFLEKYSKVTVLEGKTARRGHPLLSFNYTISIESVNKVIEDAVRAAR